MKKIKYHPTSKYAVRVLTVLIILFFNSLNANPSNCETDIFKIDQKFLSSNFSRCEILDENAIRLYLSLKINLLIIQVHGLPFESQPTKKKFM